MDWKKTILMGAVALAGSTAMKADAQSIADNNKARNSVAAEFVDSKIFMGVTLSSLKNSDRKLANIVYDEKEDLSYIVHVKDTYPQSHGNNFFDRNDELTSIDVINNKENTADSFTFDNVNATVSYLSDNARKEAIKNGTELSLSAVPATEDQMAVLTKKIGFDPRNMRIFQEAQARLMAREIGAKAQANKDQQIAIQQALGQKHKAGLVLAKND